MVDVVVCGPASWNLIVDVEALPHPQPHTTFARSSHETVGGTSAGKALHLVSLGRSVLLHTVLGTDDAASRIEGALRAAGVPLSLDVVPGPSERHVNLMDPHGGRVSIYLSLPGEVGAGSGPSVTDEFTEARALVLDLSERARELLPAAAAAPAPVWTDIHDYDGAAEFHRPWLETAEYVFMNADGLPRPLDFMHGLVDRGPARLAVCTLGSSGAVAVDEQHREHRVAATPVPAVVDTNGAGDAFLAGCLSAVLDGADVPSALRSGADQAATALATPHLGPLLSHALEERT